MNVQQLTDEIHWITKTDENTYSSADILTGLNIHNGELVHDVLRVEATRNSFLKNSRYDLLSTAGLVEGQVGYNGEYPIPTDFLRPIRVEVSYDGILWLPCQMYDISQNTMSSEYNQDQIQSAFLPASPYFSPAYNPVINQPIIRFQRDSFTIRPLNDQGTIPNGLVIWYESREAALVNTTDSPSIESNYHDLYVLKSAMRYARRFPEKMNQAWLLEYTELKKSILEYYRNRFKYNAVMRPSFESFK